MTIHRYRLVGPTVTDFKRYVDPNISTVNVIRRQTDMEVDLQDGEELGTLDQYMGTMGYQRVTGSEANGLLTSDLVTFGALTIGIAGTDYLLPFGIAAGLAAEIQIVIFGTRRFRNIGVKATAAGTGGGDLTFTLRKNGGNSSLAIVVANASTGGNTTISTDEVFNNGDLMSLSVTKSGIITTTPINIMVTVA